MSSRRTKASTANSLPGDRPHLEGARPDRLRCAFVPRSRTAPSLTLVTAVQRWERRSEVPLLLLAVAFLVAYAWPVLDPRLDADLLTVLTVA